MYLPEDTDIEREFQKFGSVLDAIAETLRGIPQLSKCFREISALGVDASGPPKVSVVGGFNAGKSTFLNALLGYPVLKADVLPANAAVVVLTYAQTPALHAHASDGSTEAFDPKTFHSLAFEGDPSSAKLRRSSTHFTLGLPYELLKKVSFVDTPGLGALHNAHSEATLAFLHRIDALVWITPVTEAGTATELRAIRDVGKPIDLLVVNRMDAFDAEEENESPEGAVKRIARTFGHPSETAIGVSASQAFRGKQDSLPNLIEESNWISLETILGSVILVNAAASKRKSVEERAFTAFEALASKIHDIAIEITSERNEIESSIERLHNERIRGIARLAGWNKASTLSQLLALSRKSVSIPLQDRMRRLKQTVKECRQDAERLKAIDKQLEKDAQDFVDRQDSIYSRRRVQREKGFFESIGEFFFGGGNQQIQIAQEALDRDRDSSAQRRRELENDQSDIEAEMAECEAEAATILELGREELHIEINSYRLQLLALRRKKRVWRWAMSYRDHFFQAVSNLWSLHLRSLDTSASFAFRSTATEGRIFVALDRFHEECEALLGVKPRLLGTRLRQAYVSALSRSVDTHSHVDRTAAEWVELLQTSLTHVPGEALLQELKTRENAENGRAHKFATSFLKLQQQGEDIASGSVLGAFMGSCKSTTDEFDQVLQALPQISPDARNTLLYSGLCANASLDRYVLVAASRGSLAHHKALTSLGAGLLGLLNSYQVTALEG
jgi:hypothetical protein